MEHKSKIWSVLLFLNYFASFLLPEKKLQPIPDPPLNLMGVENG
jgi:hypothetical protein